MENEKYCIRILLYWGEEMIKAIFPDIDDKKQERIFENT